MMGGPPELRVGLVGTGWIVRAHVHALHTLGHLQPLPYKIRVVVVSGRNREKVEALAAEVGTERWTSDWQRLVEDPEVDIVANLATFLGPSDDALFANFDLPDGGTVSLQASRCATGWKGRHRVEIEGGEGSAWWDMEDLNRLHVYFVTDEREGFAGYRDVLVTDASYPFMSPWWLAGHVIGRENTFVHQWRAFLDAVRGADGDPLQADFTDGLRALELADAVRRSALDGEQVAVSLTKGHEADLAEVSNLASASANRKAVDGLASLDSTDRRLP